MTDQILSVSRAFCAARGLSPSRVSTLIFNDGKKIGLIEAGADLTTGKFEHALRWFSENWPADLEWPDGVPRPDPAAEDHRNSAGA